MRSTPTPPLTTSCTSGVSSHPPRQRAIRRSGRSGHGDVAEAREGCAGAAGGRRQGAATVEGILADVERRGDEAVRGALAQVRRLRLPEDFFLSRADIEAAMGRLRQRVLDDIAFAQAQVRNFAQRQKECLRDITWWRRCRASCRPSLTSRSIRSAATSRRRYPMIASAHMSVVTAKVAGVSRVIASAPPHKGAPHPAIVAAMHMGGADEILVLGGVQAVAAMALGTESIRPVDMLVRPRQRLRAEAKRQLYGRVGIDLFAGPHRDSWSSSTRRSTPRCARKPTLLGQASMGRPRRPC